MGLPRAYHVLINDIPYTLAEEWARLNEMPASKWIEREPRGSIQRPDAEVGAFTTKEESDWDGESYANWQDGMGQRSLDHADANRSRYETGWRLDGSRQGELRLQPASEELGGITGRTPTGVACSAGGVYYAVWRNATSDDDLYYYNDALDTWTAITKGAGVDASPTDGQISAVGTDGHHVYLAVTGSPAGSNGIFRYIPGGATVWISHVEKVSAMSCYAGYLCLARDNVSGETGLPIPVPDGSSAGYLDWAAEPNRAYVPCTPNPASIWNPSLVTVGLITHETHVYWLTKEKTGGEEALLTRYNPIIAGYDFCEVARLPRGFVPTSIEAYSSRIFVGGHERTPTIDYKAVSASGIGVIYAVVPGEAWERLVHIGESELDDNRVFAMACWQRWLYFIAGASIYRWNLARGGYEHVDELELGVPVEHWSDVGAAWTLVWDGSADPGSVGYVAEQSTSPPPALAASYTASVAYFRVANAAWTVWHYDDPLLTGDGMMEFKVQGICSDAGIHGIANDEASLAVRTVADKAKAGTYATLYVRRREVYIDKNGVTKTRYVWDSLGKYEAQTGSENWITARLILDDTEKIGKVFVNGELKRSLAYTHIPASAEVFPDVPVTNTVWFSIGGPVRDQTNKQERIYFDYVQYVRGLLIDPPPTTIVGAPAGLDAYYGCAFASISTKAVYRTRRELEQVYQTSGYAIMSASSCGWAGIAKYLRYVELVHDPINAGESVLVTIIVDGQEQDTLTFDQAVCGGASRSLIGIPSAVALWPGIEAATISAKVQLKGPGYSTPVVRGVNLLATLETVNRYQFVLNCYDQTPDSSGSGVAQPYDGQILIDNLRQVRGRPVSFDTALTGPFIGRIESLEFHDGVHTNASASEYQGIVVLQVREL